jgi:2-desacetyl-2-hydroxyethyl bacteriochlorophyllide A dehydrogenase
MRALLCDRPGQLRLIEQDEPTPGHGEVLVRIRRAGVCGTDLHIFQGSHPFLEYPRVMGHELAGEVAAVGAGVGIEPGRRVCVIPYLACGRCAACRRGKTNCCAAISVLGVHRDGGFADYVVVPEAYLLPTDDLGLDETAMIEFLAIGAHAVRRSALTKRDRVLVVGGGPIGMSALVFAKARGAVVTVLDLRADRLAFCQEQLGADHTVTVGEGAEAQLRELTDGEFFETVFDASGHQGSMERSLGFVAHGGTYVLLGIVMGALSFADPELHKRETTLLASRNATLEDFAEVLRVMRAGGVPTKVLATHRAALADVPARFASWTRPETGVVKALIEL